MVNVITRIENLAVVFGVLYFYQQISGNWYLFFLFLLVPDISMIGYLINKKIGAITYNLVHNYILASLLIAIGFFANNITFHALGLILTAHVGIDRVLGFGLKYSSGFKDTHMQRL
jgi:hypothetical protein